MKHAQIQDEVVNQSFDEIPPYQLHVNDAYTESLPPQDEQARPWYFSTSWWLLISGTSSLLLSTLYSWITSYLTSIETHPIAASLLISMQAIFILLIIWLILRESFAYQRIAHLPNMTESVRHAVEDNQKAVLLKLLQQRSQAQSNSPAARRYHQQFWQSIQPHHHAGDIFAIYQNKVIEPLTKLAESRLQPAIAQAAGMSLLSPNNTIHTAILLWRSLVLVREIARVYGVRPGFFGSVKLFKLSLENMIIQQGMDVLIDAGVNRLSHGLLSKVVEKGAEATTTGLLMRRLGKAVIDLMDISQEHYHNT